MRSFLFPLLIFLTPLSPAFGESENPKAAAPVPPLPAQPQPEQIPLTQPLTVQIQPKQILSAQSSTGQHPVKSPSPAAPDLRQAPAESAAPSQDTARQNSPPKQTAPPDHSPSAFLLKSPLPAGLAPDSLPPGFSLRDKSRQELFALAMSYLKQNQTEKALAPLQRLFYEYLFFPSYRILRELGHPPSLLPLMWHLTAGFFALLSLFLLAAILWKKPLAQKNKIRWKLPALWLFALGLLSLSGFFALRPRASAARETKILSAPFPEALSLKKIPAGADLLILDKKGDWRKVKAPESKYMEDKDLEGADQSAIGWVMEQDLFITLGH